MGLDVADRIAASVSERPPVNGIRIVGVDGRSGAGKSFLASRLSSLLSALIIEIDDFVSWECFAGWWPRFDEQVLSPLLAGRDATYQARDWTDWYGSTLGGWKTQRWSPTIILEGVTCTRRDTIGRLAYAIWVEAPAKIRLARGMARDTRFPGKEDLWQQWMREEDESSVLMERPSEPIASWIPQLSESMQLHDRRSHCHAADRAHEGSYCY